MKERPGFRIGTVPVSLPASVPSTGYSESRPDGLPWVDVVKGLAIVGVILDNWMSALKSGFPPGWLPGAVAAFVPVFGPLVQAFFVLSGFGLTLAYLQRKGEWNWGKWIWRRSTKVLVPYELAVVFAFLLGLLGSALFKSIALRFSFKDFLAYVFLYRNFDPSSWVWNQTFWFIPVIVGLYISFPVLVKILDRFGPWTVLAVSWLVSYGTLAAAFFSGLHRNHGDDFFTFWLFSFALGMAAAYGLQKRGSLRFLTGWGPFLLGLGLTAVSWGVRTYIHDGDVFNDALTSAGIFLILFNLASAIRSNLPGASRILSALGRRSYLMYLIHYPIIAFLIQPSLPTMSPLLVLALGLTYTALVYWLAAAFSPAIRAITGSLERSARPSA